MTQRIFKSMLSVAGATILICFLLIVGILYQYFDDQMTIELEKKAGYLSAAVEVQGVDYLKSLNDDQRITLIGRDGNVVFDNQANETQMENHLEREEIKEAMETGVGASERYSTTLSSKTIYYALKLSDGSILRVASYQNSVFYLLFGLIQPIGIVLLIMLCLAAYMSNRVSKKVTEPINKLDLDHPEENTAYPELDPLLAKIYRQKVRIREQMDLATRQQTEFKIITDHMDEGFVIVAKDLSILSYNESIKKHLGVLEELQGASIYIINHENSFIDFIEKTMDGNHNEWLQNVDGHYYQWISNPVIQNEQISGAVIVMMDVTEKTKRENYRREFTANVSHELKTPLTSISGFAEIILNGIAKEDDIQNFAGDIFKESQRLIQLVNDIIRLSQLDDESIVYHKEPVSIQEQIDKCLEPLLHSANKARVMINKVGEDFTFDTVPNIFQEILFNLVDNGIKYNKENGHVDIIYSKDENKVRITILDNGIGIPAQDQDRIFERFYRVDKGRSSKKGGTGLGLSIVKHGVATLNGHIELESVLHQGTKVTIDLPFN